MNLDALHPAWHRRAACRGMDVATFFPKERRSTQDARQICAGCPVRTDCLAYARSHGVEGIWGGRRFDGRAAAPTTTTRSA
jgi:WhiB family redox-sensing transcriptional regulator